MKNQINYSLLSELDAIHGDHFYLLKEQNLRDNIKEFKGAMSKHYRNVILGYSFKTNYIPRACKVAYEEGAYPEIVSEMELNIVKKLSLNPNKIIYNGPNKTPESIEYCLINGAILNVDNFTELNHVIDLCKKNPSVDFSIGLRLNLDLKDDFISRFGFDPNSKDFNEACLLIKNINNLFIKGLHTHSTRPAKDVTTFSNKLELLYEVYNKYFNNFDIQYLDIGGGFYGKMDSNIRSQFHDIDVPCFSDYGNVISKQMKEYFPEEDVALIVEPGVALCVNILDFVCKITDVKSIGNQLIATSSGSFHNVKPTGHKKNLTLEVFHKNTPNTSNTYEIGGFTCLENDYLYNGYKGSLSVDDYCMFKNVGAYTLVFKPPFIKLSPAILSFIDGDYKAVKNSERFDHTFESYHF